MRDSLSDILVEFGKAHEIQNQDCMKMIADILRYTLTIFVHEEVADYKFLYVILEFSQSLYISTTKNRKVYLSSLLYDHGIW